MVVLVVGSLLPASWARFLSSHPRHVLTAIAAPAQHLLKPLADRVRRPADLSVDLGNQEEYERAKQQIVQLQHKLHEANLQIAELSQLRNELKLTGVGLVPATAVAWSGDTLHSTLTINRGTRHGLSPGLVAVRGFNLVGQLSDVSPTAATVRLVTASQTSLVVMIVPPNDSHQPRQLMTQLRAAPERNEFWASINTDDTIETGDLAYLMDDGWPEASRGFVVGTVVQIDKDPDDPILRRRVVVAPIRSLAHLDHLTVIVPIDPSSSRAANPQPLTD